MRLVIDGRRLTVNRTGVGRTLEMLLEEWSKTRLPLERGVLVLQDRRVGASLPAVEGLSVRVVGALWPGIVWETLGLGRILRQGDLLFAPANFVPWNWQGPTLLIVYDLLGEVLPQRQPWHVRAWYGGRARHAGKRANRIVAPSETTRSDIERFWKIDPQRIEVVPLAPAAGFQPRTGDDRVVLEARRAVGLGEHEPFFLFVGKRSRRRNIPLIVDAYRRLQPEYRSLKLVLVGPGGGPDDHDLVGRSGLIVAGHVSEEVLHGLMSSALALLYPSEHEGFGLPIVEAMASGCPLITLRTPIAVEVAGDAAFHLAEASTESLQAAMRVLLESPAERARLAALGIERSSYYRRHTFAQRIADAIRDLAAGFEGPPNGVEVQADRGPWSAVSS